MFAQRRFGDAVRALCAPYYEADARKGGHPGIDPELHFKMLIVGFFENLAAERAIAARCADSLAIRAFPHYINEITSGRPAHVKSLERDRSPRRNDTRGYYKFIKPRRLISLMRYV